MRISISHLLHEGCLHRTPQVYYASHGRLRDRVVHCVTQCVSLRLLFSEGYLCDDCRMMLSQGPAQGQEGAQGRDGFLQERR